MEMSGQFHTMTTLSPRNDPPVPTKKKAGWTQGPVWTFRRRGKSLALPGFLGFPARSLVSIPTTLSRLPVSTCSHFIFQELADIMRALYNVHSDQHARSISKDVERISNKLCTEYLTNFCI